MDIAGTKGINVLSYTSDIKKVESKNGEKSDITKIQGVKEDLATDTFVKSTEQETVNLTYKPVKNKLSTEEVKSLKEQQENQKSELIKRFISDTINNQNKLLGKLTGSGTDEMSVKTSDLLIKIFGTLENAYPPMATTPEGAKEAIAEGGTYSVNAVADRIMTMAKAIAGDDPDKIQQMREAVEKGFSEAGVDFKKATDSDLPQICKDTIAEVMKRFDELQNITSSNE